MAKKRGEILPSIINAYIEKDKFDKANEYIANTTTLRKIPMVQREYVNNNYIAERRYDNLIRNNINNNANKRNDTGSISTITGATETVSKVVIKKIPERKNTIYTNFEKKLDKDNDLTKQKIKARTELKSIFKEIQNKELSKEEVEDLNLNIENIKKKYPNTITDKTLNKLYDTFKVKLPTVEKEQEHENAEKDNNVQPIVESKVVTPKAKMSKEELMESLKKAETHSTKYMHATGIDLLIINKLICYLKDNNDPEIQEKLNKEIIKLQTDRHEITDNLYIYNSNHTNIQTLKYMYDNYRNGVKSNDGTREIISTNPNAAAYYLYLAYNVAKNANSKGKESDKKEIIDKFESNKEETCYRYFEFLKEKYNVDKCDGIERLKNEALFMNELKSARMLKFNNSEYVDLMILKELVSRTAKYKDDFIIKIGEIEKRKKIQPVILNLFGNIYYKGIKSASNQEIIKPDMKKARDMYEQVISRKGISIETAETCMNLISIYNDKTTPLYDKVKADKLMKIVDNKGIHIQEKTSNVYDSKPSVYVCSDLHGEYQTYKAITKQLKEKDKLYILGDVIDRGPDGIKILQDIMKRKEKGQIELIIGNHEFNMIRTLCFNSEEAKKLWESDGAETIKKFEMLDDKEQNAIKEFLLDSYVYKNIKVNSENIDLVHAKAVQDRNDNSDKTLRELLEEKKETTILDAVEGEQTSKPETFTVVGHKPTFDMIELHNCVLDIDCGASYGDNAALVNLSNGTVKYIDSKYEREKENKKQQGK